jgi:hypothetical protein
MTYRSTPSSSRSSACCSRMHEIGHQTHRTEDRTAVNAGLSIDAVPHNCRFRTGERQRYGPSRKLGVNNGGCRVEKEAEGQAGQARRPNDEITTPTVFFHSASFSPTF